MDNLSQLLLPPGAEHVALQPYLIAFMFLLYIPFVGLAWVCSAVSVALLTFRPEAARSLNRVVAITPGTVLCFVLLPLASLTILFGQYLFGQSIPVGAYLVRVSLPIFAGFCLLFLYQRQPRTLTGALGVLLVLSGNFLLTAVLTLIATPEKWPFIHSPVPLVFSVNVVIQFLEFVATSAILGGAGILFFLFHWPEKKLPAGTPHADQIRRTALALVLVGGLVSPVLLLWDLYTQPDYALAEATFWLAGAMMAVLLLISLWSLVRFFRPCGANCFWLFVLAVVLAGLGVARVQTLQANANQEQQYLLAQDSLKALDLLKAERQALYAKNVQADAALGERVFNERCSACHQFDQKVVGPPYNQVLPKYQADPEKLKAFLRNPYKIDPAYPAMPNQGLSELEVQSVAAFLLGHLDSTK